MDTKSKRSIVLAGHAQSGKTTLAESMLFLSKATARKGAVAEGTTVNDYSPDEIESRHSISLAVSYCQYRDCRIQVVDTPGYADFFGETVAGMRAADAAVIVVDAHAGVEAGTERVWQLLEELGLPCAFFINKADKPGVDVGRVLEQIRDRMSPKAMRIEALDDPALIEALAETDDKLIEEYLESGHITPDEERAALQVAVHSRKVFPVFSGSALTDDGVRELLDAIVVDFPSPLERRAVPARFASGADKRFDLRLSDSGPLAAVAFKIVSDSYVGQLTLLRIFSGSIVSNGELFCANRSSRERVGHVFLLQGREQRPVERASCGDIVAIAKLKDVSVSDTICDEKEPVLFDPIAFPEAVIALSVKPKSRDNEEKLAVALHKLASEDPTLRVTHDPQTKELIIAGLGEMHLTMAAERIRKRFNVDVELATPKVPYRETITRPTKVQGKFKRQSGGRGQYGDVWIEVQPLARGAGIEFVNKVVGGAIPRNYIPSVEKGVRQASEEGAAAGYPVVDLRVILYDGSYHEVDSSDMAFQIAGAMALRAAVREAGPVLLEPVMDVDVFIPEQYLGAATGDVNARRGRVTGMAVKGRLQVLSAQVPQAELFKYANDLRSMTGGRGAFTARQSHYEEVPHKIAGPIIARYQAESKHEHD